MLASQPVSQPASQLKKKVGITKKERKRKRERERIADLVVGVGYQQVIGGQTEKFEARKKKILFIHKLSQQ